MNLSIKIESYGEARVTLDLGREFAQRVLNEMGAGDDFVCPVPGYYVYDSGDDYLILVEGPVPRWPTFGPSGPVLCVGRVDGGGDAGPFVFGISTEVTVRYPDLDYTVDPTELDLDARLEAARVLRLALRAFDVIQ